MRRRRSTALLVIVALALVARLAVMVATPDFKPIFDAADYERHAQSIAAGNGYPPAQLAPGPSAFRPPLYPLVLAAVDLVGGGWTSFRLLGALLGVVTVMLIFEIARRLWGPRVGVTAGAIAAVFPPLVVLNASFLSESLFVPLVLAVLLAVLRYRDDRRVRWAIAAGVLCGLAGLTRTNGLLLVIPAALGVWVLRPRMRRTALVPPLVVGLAALVTVAPWVARNAMAFDRFVGFASPTGYLLAGTYGEEARDLAQHPGEPRAAHQLRSYGDVFGRRDLDEVERWEILSERGREYMIDHPGYVVASMAWNGLRLADLEREGRYEPSFQFHLQAVGVERLAKPLPYLGSIVLLIAVALVGAVMQLRSSGRRGPGFVWLFPVLLLAPAVLMFGLARYRAPADPFLIMLAAIALVGLAERFVPRLRASHE